MYGDVLAGNVQGDGLFSKRCRDGLIRGSRKVVFWREYRGKDLRMRKLLAVWQELEMIWCELVEEIEGWGSPSSSEDEDEDESDLFFPYAFILGDMDRDETKATAFDDL